MSVVSGGIDGVHVGEGLGDPVEVDDAVKSLVAVKLIELVNVNGEEKVVDRDTVRVAESVAVAQAKGLPVGEGEQVQVREGLVVPVGDPDKEAAALVVSVDDPVGDCELEYESDEVGLTVALINAEGETLAVGDKHQRSFWKFWNSRPFPGHFFLLVGKHL